MSGDVQRARPLFIDTGAFFARFNNRDAHHESATAVFSAISNGDLAYRSLYTSGYVLSELATLMERKTGNHADAVEALNRANSPSVKVLHPNAEIFADTCREFERFYDQEITFVDHTSAVLARKIGTEYIFAYDKTDFRTLGLTVVPGDTGEP